MRRWFGERSSAPPKQKKEIQLLEQENFYERTVQAVNSLHEMSLKNEHGEERTTEYLTIIRHGKGFLQERLANRETLLETLPIVNRLARIHRNYQDRDPLFHDLRLKEIASEAAHILPDGLESVDEGLLRNLTPDQALELVRAVDSIVHSPPSDWDIEIAVNFWTDHADQFTEMAFATKHFSLKESLTKLRLYLKQNPTFEMGLAEVIQDATQARGSDQVYGLKILGDLLEEKYGLNPKVTLDAWMSKKEGKPQIQANILAIMRLERQHPGIASFLMNNSGIRNFNRYPPGLLIRQYQEFDDVNKPYGIILNPANDWNGAYSENTALLWEKLDQKLNQKGYQLRVVEAATKYEAGRRLFELDQRYGEHHKISFAFVGGHGTKASIQFGGEDKRHRLYSKDLTSPVSKGVAAFAGKAQHFFEPHPTIVLNSCSTGAAEGLGREISRTLNAKVIAPNRPTIIQTIQAQENPEGQIDFEVGFHQKGGEDVKKRVFVVGKEID